jgi:hypothetical protein
LVVLLQAAEGAGNGIEQITRVSLLVQFGVDAPLASRVAQSHLLRLTAAKVGYFVERHSK